MTTPRWIKSAYVKSILAILLIICIVVTCVCLNSYDVFSSSALSTQDKERLEFSKTSSLKSLVAAWLKGESLYEKLNTALKIVNEVDVKDKLPLGVEFLSLLRCLSGVENSVKLSDNLEILLAEMTVTSKNKNFWQFLSVLLPLLIKKVQAVKFSKSLFFQRSWTVKNIQQIFQTNWSFIQKFFHLLLQTRGFASISFLQSSQVSERVESKMQSNFFSENFLFLFRYLKLARASLQSDSEDKPLRKVLGPACH